ncbi:MAG: hypothetical protein IGBAC_1567 [Ignavibacteriae bacterium]|nr:MAG: hypothetical protein IGBAC_1567 [Ignavibacteriota bacterium]
MNNLTERFQYLITKALDGNLNSEEKVEFEKLISESKDFQNEWNSLKEIKEVTKSMKFKEPPQELWDKYWLSVYSRLERGIAWILISIGASIILIYGGFKLIESIIGDATLTWILKTAILAIIIGFVLLLVSVIRERFFLKKTDKYKEIIR